MAKSVLFSVKPSVDIGWVKILVLKMLHALRCSYFSYFSLASQLDKGEEHQNNSLFRYLFHFIVYYRSTFNNHGNKKKGKEESRTFIFKLNELFFL